MTETKLRELVPGNGLNFEQKVFLAYAAAEAADEVGMELVMLAFRIAHQHKQTS